MVPLGVSVGDVIAVSKLLTTIIAVLRDSTKAVSEYEELLLLLQRLQNTFGIVEAHVEAWRAPDSVDGVHLSVLNAIGVEIGGCEKVLIQLRKSLSRYARPPSKYALASLLHEPIRSIQWRLSLQEDARTASQKLLPHMQALQILLEVSTKSVSPLSSLEKMRLVSKNL